MDDRTFDYFQKWAEAVNNCEKAVDSIQQKYNIDNSDMNDLIRSLQNRDQSWTQYHDVLND